MSAGVRETDRETAPASVTLRRMGIDTFQLPVVYLRHDSAVCRSEGFEAQTRIEVRLDGQRIIASLNIVTGAGLGEREAGLSEIAWSLLGAKPGDAAHLRHAPPLESLAALRGKVYGRRTTQDEYRAMIGDIAAGRYSDLELAAFVTACAGDRLDLEETILLTRAMVEAGSTLRWPRVPVVDKHCIGGLPGNRTSLIVVPIVAACGLLIPKTSSRAITSPSGTADTMETLAPVALDLAAMRRVVEVEGGCIVWGGAARLSPADDVLIRVERPLDFDSEGQLVASVLSKKIAAGSSHIVIDVPVGPTAKVRTAASGEHLCRRLEAVGSALGLTVRTRVSDGHQPVGRGIGPALEARDVLAVLRNDPRAPQDLRERALSLAAEILEMAGLAALPAARARAQQVLEGGGAWKKFQAIAGAQGGLREPPAAAFRREVHAGRAGIVQAFDNRKLARLAKLAGAPHAPAAGVDLHAALGDVVARDEPLFTLHAETAGELAYALEYLGDHADIVTVSP